MLEMCWSGKPEIAHKVSYRATRICWIDCREGAIGNENGQIRPAKADNIASTEATVSVGGHLMLG